MSDKFESWARAEITRLRDEANHLDRTLTRYLADQTNKSAPLNDGRISRQSAPSAVSTNGSGSVVPRKRSSKNDPILIAIDRAGPYGLSMDEIMAAAASAGITANRNAIRSFCWNEKQNGRLIQPDIGRFASAPSKKDEAAGPTSHSEPTASASDHNRHHEGDAGGGI